MAPTPKYSVYYTVYNVTITRIEEDHIKANMRKRTRDPWGSWLDQLDLDDMVVEERSTQGELVVLEVKVYEGDIQPFIDLLNTLIDGEQPD